MFSQLFCGNNWKKSCIKVWASFLFVSEKVVFANWIFLQIKTEGFIIVKFNKNLQKNVVISFLNCWWLFDLTTSKITIIYHLSLIFCHMISSPSMVKTDLLIFVGLAVEIKVVGICSSAKLHWTAISVMSKPCEAHHSAASLLFILEKLIAIIILF